MDSTNRGELVLSAWAITRGARGWASRLLVLLMVPLFFACASLTPEDTDTWRDSQRARLMARADARWKALIAGDWETAYGYQSPAYRAVVSLQQFKGGFGRGVNWHLARIDNIQYDSPTVAVVSAAVTYASLVRGREVESVRTMTEKWLYSDGDWWYTSAN